MLDKLDAAMLPLCSIFTAWCVLIAFADAIRRRRPSRKDDE